MAAAFHGRAASSSVVARRPLWRRLLSIAALLFVGVWIGRATAPATEGGPSAVGALVRPATAGANDAAPRDMSDAAARCRELLEAAQRRLHEAPAVAAVFHKRERIGGVLQPLNVVDLRVRREPLAVHLCWREPEAGREVVWRADENDGKMLVRVGGWRRRIVPVLRIDPQGDTALEYSRRPITSIGPWSFADRLLRFVRDEATGPEVAARMGAPADISGRACRVFEFVNAVESAARPWRRVVIYIDRDWGLPVGCERYVAANEAAGEALDESYAFTELDLEASWSDADFELTPDGASTPPLANR